jgi:hypothetical protein
MARFDNKMWSAGVNRLLHQVRADDPTEYLGSYQEWSYNFIADSSRFPWLPVKVCETSDIPF